MSGMRGIEGGPAGGGDLAPGAASPGRADPVFTHLDSHGRAHMVDVTGKAVTERRAVARGVVVASPSAVEAATKEEDLLAFAKAAGMQAAKQAPSLIPLCHPLPLDTVDIAVTVAGGRVEIAASTAVVSRTGVEIEALTACSVAGLTIAMALLPHDPGARLTTVGLWHKSGGRSGVWERAAPRRHLAPPVDPDPT